MADPTGTDQTSPSDAGHTTSENFWTRVVVVLGSVVSIASLIGDVVLQATNVLPADSSILRWASLVGAGVALVSKISYEISRTIVKSKLVDAEIAAATAPTRTPESAAAAVLGGP